MDVDAPTTSSSNPAPSDDQAASHDPEPEWMTRLRSVDTILGGEKTVALHQEFLIRNNHTDLQILKKTKVDVVYESGFVLFRDPMWHETAIRYFIKRF